MKSFLFIFPVLAAFCPLTAHASPLVYQPINPTFGGNPFNSSHLQQMATTQKQYEKPTPRTNPLSDFSDSVTRAIMSRASREIAEAIYGENAQDSGSFTFGNATIDFERVGDKIVIDIFDALTGGSTTVEVPVLE